MDGPDRVDFGLEARDRERSRNILFLVLTEFILKPIHMNTYEKDGRVPRKFDVSRERVIDETKWQQILRKRRPRDAFAAPALPRGDGE